MFGRFGAAFSSGAIACWQATESRVRDAKTRTNEAGLDRDWLKLVCRRRIAAGNETVGSIAAEKHARREAVHVQEAEAELAHEKLGLGLLRCHELRPRQGRCKRAGTSRI